MPTIGDKLREMRQTYRRMSEAATRMEQAAQLASASYADLQRDLQAARREAARLRAILLRPAWLFLAGAVLGGFAGSALYWSARRAAGWFWSLWG